MSRIIKNKIEFTMFGVPTISDKYDVISAIVPAGKKVYGGQLVDATKLFKGVGDWTTVEATTTRFGVVMHQNVQLGRTKNADGNVITSEMGPDDMSFTGGQSIGICIKGFISVPSDNDAPTKVTTNGTLGTTGTNNLGNLDVFSTVGQQQWTPESKKYLFEVEVK